MSEKPSVSDLRQLMRYNALEGQLYWRERAPSWFQNDPRGTACEIWNKKYAGKPAFTSVRRHTGARQGAVLGYHTSAQVIVWALSHGAWPKGRVIFLDHDKLNLKPDNLRDVSAAEELAHRPAYRNNRTGHRGVYWNSQTKKYQIVIYEDGEQRTVGYAKDLEKAVEIRDAARARSKILRHSSCPAHNLNTIT